LVSIAIIYWIQLIEVHTNLFFLILCTLLFIFLTSAEKQLRHLLENNQLLYSLHCSLLTPHVLIVHQVHHQDQSLSKRLQTYNHLSREKIVRNNAGLNNVHCKIRTDIKRPLENSPFIAQNCKSTFHVPSCSAQAVVIHTFFNTRVRSTKRSKNISV
jgi:hypothetical protein